MHQCRIKLEGLQDYRVGAWDVRAEVMICHRDTGSIHDVRCPTLRDSPAISGSWMGRRWGEHCASVHQCHRMYTEDFLNVLLLRLKELEVGRCRERGPIPQDYRDNYQHSGDRYKQGHVWELQGQQT